MPLPLFMPRFLDAHGAVAVHDLESDPVSCGHQTTLPRLSCGKPLACTGRLPATFMMPALKLRLTVLAAALVDALRVPPIIGQKIRQRGE